MRTFDGSSSLFILLRLPSQLSVSDGVQTAVWILVVRGYFLRSGALSLGAVPIHLDLSSYTRG